MTPVDRPANRTRSESSTSEPAAPNAERDLTLDEQRAVQQLRRIDREVRAHEQAHKAVAGKHAVGGPSYEFSVGPDGQRYAVGGEVQIDTSPVPNDPAATIEKMRAVERAALAPARPSSQDFQVAAQARQERLEAETERRDDLRESRAVGTSSQNVIDRAREAYSADATAAAKPALLDVVG